MSLLLVASVSAVVFYALERTGDATANAIATAMPELGNEVAERYGRDLAPLVVVEDGRLNDPRVNDGPALLKTWAFAVQNASRPANTPQHTDAWGRPFCEVSSPKSLLQISQGTAATPVRCAATSIPDALLKDMPRGKLIKTAAGNLIFIIDRKG